jgi:hypothetical protein
VADQRLHTYLVLLAPVLARVDGVTDDPADVEVAEAILAAAESADGVGLTRAEIAARAGLDMGDPRFAARFDMLDRARALQHLRGDKKHQRRYLPDPVALLAAEILARLSQDQGAEELHSLLVAAADRLEASFHDDADVRAPTVEEVAVLVAKLSVLLHAYAQRMEAAVTAGTYAELTRARTGSSTSRQMAQIERVCRAINRHDSPYGRLFHDALLTCKNGRCAASVAPPRRTRLPSTFPPPDAPPTRPAGHALDQGGRPTRMGEVTRRGEAAQAASGAAPEEAGPTAASGPSWLRVGPRGGCGSVTGSSRLRRTSLRSTSGARGHGVRRRLPRPVGVRMARDPCVQLTGFRLRTRRSDAKLTALPEPGEHSAGSCNSDASISSPRRPLWRGQLQVSSARWRSLANLL